jgi:hypothetical protein
MQPPPVDPAAGTASAAGTLSSPGAGAQSPAVAVIDPAAAPPGPAGAVAESAAAPSSPAGAIDPANLVGPGAQPSGDRPSRRSVGKETARRRVEPGILSVTSVPWSWVTVGNQTKETPGAKFYLSPGTYHVTFHNQENGLVKVERVTIEAGKMKKLSERMDR